MPAVLPTYTSQDAIPEALRPYYKQNGAVWELWDDNEAVAKYFNTGLAANRDALRSEKDQMKTRAENAEAQVTNLTNEKTQFATQKQQAVEQATSPLNTRINELTTELNTVKTPGAVVIPKDKADALAKYETLGTPDDLTKKVKEVLPELERKVSTFDRAEELRTIAAREDVAFNYDVLRDIMELPRNAGLSIKLKKVKDPNDESKKIDVPHVFWKEGEAGKETEHDLALTDYAEQHWQSHHASLYVGEASERTTASTGEKTGEKPTGTRLPEQRRSGGGKDKAGTFDVKSFINTANEARNTGTNPLIPKKQPAATT